MKNDPFPRPSLASRISSLDGSIHANQAARDAHDAMKRSQEATRGAQDAARQNRENFNRSLRTPRPFEKAASYSGQKASARGVLGFLLIILVIAALAWLTTHK